MKDRAEAKAHLALWVDEERNNYATQKWEEENQARQIEIVHSGEWLNFPFSYLQRARAGLDTLQGRQALGKVITSSMSLLERAMIEFDAEMPMPGMSSTDGAVEWIRDEPEPDEEGQAVPEPFANKLEVILGIEVDRETAYRYWMDPLVYNLINTVHQLNEDAVQAVLTTRERMDVQDPDPHDCLTCGSVIDSTSGVRCPSCVQSDYWPQRI